MVDIENPEPTEANTVKYRSLQVYIGGSIICATLFWFAYLLYQP